MSRRFLAALGFVPVVLACKGDDPNLPTPSDGGSSGTSGSSGTVGGKLAFVTKGLYNGKLGQSGGGTAAGDATCDAEAVAAGINGRSFHALLAVGTMENAVTRAPAGPWKMSRGEDVISKANWGDRNNVLINRTADGAIVPSGDLVWTGADDAGNPYLSGGTYLTCANWTDDGTGSLNGRLGAIAPPNAGEWLSQTNGGCAEMRHLYCLEK